jgi:muramoyltetrapeptide carboxypeptidase
MIDEVNFSSIETNPKWIIGYSDPTVLHCHIHNLGVATIHGQMCLEIENKTEATRDTLKNILFGNYDAIKFASDFKLNRTGHAKGQLIGGNLSVLSSVLGSKSTIKTEGKILFLEDLDEYLYHIDRMVHNIKRNGFFKNLAGLVIGGLTDMHDNTSPFGQSAEEIIANAVKEFNFPVCFNFPAGHSKDNRALIFGAETELIVTKDNVVLKTEA